MRPRCRECRRVLLPWLGSLPFRPIPVVLGCQPPHKVRPCWLPGAPGPPASLLIDGAVCHRCAPRVLLNSWRSFTAQSLELACLLHPNLTASPGKGPGQGMWRTPGRARPGSTAQPSRLCPRLRPALLPRPVGMPAFGGTCDTPSCSRGSLINTLSYRC